MFKFTLSFVFLFALTGCTAISTLPSMQYCSHVKYERNGVDIVVEAKCSAPIGGSGL